MAYKVELNRASGNSRLVYVATVHRDNIDKIGSVRRRIIRAEVTRAGLPGFWDYHVTKGWRRSRP